MGDEQSMISPAMDCFASLSSGRPLQPGPWFAMTKWPDLRSSPFDCRLHSPPEETASGARAMTKPMGFRTPAGFSLNPSRMPTSARSRT
jgi:hypothetical protein